MYTPQVAARKHRRRVFMTLNPQRRPPPFDPRTAFHYNSRPLVTISRSSWTTVQRAIQDTTPSLEAGLSSRGSGCLNSYDHY